MPHARFSAKVIHFPLWLAGYPSLPVLRHPATKAAAEHPAEAAASERARKSAPRRQRHAHAA